MNSRILIGAVVGVALAAVCLADPAPVQPPTTPAPAAAERPLPWPKGGPRLMWEVALDTGSAGPVACDGQVFVMDRSEEEGQTHRDILRVFNMADGKELWRYAYDAPWEYRGKDASMRGSQTRAAVDDKYVFIVGPFGQFQCISRQTHQPVWSVNLVGAYSDRVPVYGFCLTPLLVGDLVIVAPMGRKAGLAAFRRDTGELVWKTKPFGEGESYVSPILVRIDGVDQVLMLNHKALVSVNPQTGEFLWQYNALECEQPIAPPVRVGDGLLFVASGCKAQSYLLKVAREAGEWKVSELAHNPALGSQMHPAVVVRDHLYLVANTNINARAGMVCMDFNLKVQWQTGRKPDLAYGDYALIDGIIYAMDGYDGALHAVLPDPKAYVELAWTQGLPAGWGQRPLWAPMAVSGKKLLCRSQQVLRCYDLSASADRGVR